MELMRGKSSRYRYLSPGEWALIIGGVVERRVGKRFFLQYEFMAHKIPSESPLKSVYAAPVSHISIALVKSSPKSTPSNDHDMTNLWLRFDQEFLV